MKKILLQKTLLLLMISTSVFAFGCASSPDATTTEATTTDVPSSSVSTTVNPDFPDFYGDAGETLTPSGGQLVIAESSVSDGDAHYYNVDVDGKPVFFFVVKSSDGSYRAAANACQVCFGSNLGFRQEGDNMVCNTCGNEYPMAKIATEKGGCNPGPINPDLEVVDGNVVIDMSDVEADDVVDLFI